jgi:hypothetical protein
MEAATIYLIVAGLTLVVLVGVVLLSGRGGLGERLSPLASIAFILIIAGIFFSDDRIIGYGLMGIGIAVAIVDIVVKQRRGP